MYKLHETMQQMAIINIRKILFISHKLKKIYNYLSCDGLNTI